MIRQRRHVSHRRVKPALKLSKCVRFVAELLRQYSARVRFEGISSKNPGLLSKYDLCSTVEVLLFCSISPVVFHRAPGAPSGPTTCARGLHARTSRSFRPHGRLGLAQEETPSVGVKPRATRCGPRGRPGCSGEFCFWDLTTHYWTEPTLYWSETTRYRILPIPN